MKTLFSLLLILTFSFAVYAQADQNNGPESIAGTYAGSWVSDKYNVSGSVVLIVKVEKEKVSVHAVFTGSEYFNQDDLTVKLTSLGAGIWQMDYKGVKTKIKGTGLFKNGEFLGDYKFKKYLWTDTGKWVLGLEK